MNLLYANALWLLVATIISFVWYMLARPLAKSTCITSASSCDDHTKKNATRSLNVSFWLFILSLLMLLGIIFLIYRAGKTSTSAQDPSAQDPSA